MRNSTSKRPLTEMNTGTLGTSIFARTVKASGSKMKTSLLSVPITRQLTASSSATLFFIVPMQVITVCRFSGACLWTLAKASSSSGSRERSFRERTVSRPSLPSFFKLSNISLSTRTSILSSLAWFHRSCSTALTSSGGNVNLK